MAAKKRVKQSSGMPRSRTVVATAAMTGSLEPPVRTASQNVCSKASRAAAVPGPGAGEVDDVVGEAGEGVEGVDGGTPRAQAGTPPVRGAVRPRDGGAARVALCESGIRDQGRGGAQPHGTTTRGTGRAAPAYSWTRWAASLPADEHHGDADAGLGARAGEDEAGHAAVDVRRAERAGLKERVREGERSAEVQPLGAPVVGRHEQLLPDVGGVAAGLEEGVEALTHRAGLAPPVDAGTGVRHRFQHVVAVEPSGAAGVGDARHGDEARRVGHHSPRSMIASNAPSQSSPKWMLWWRRCAPDGRRRRRARRPRRASSHRRARARRAHPRQEAVVGDGQVDGADDGVRRDPVTVRGPDAGHGAVGPRRTSRTSTPRWIRTPASVSA